MRMQVGDSRSVAVVTDLCESVGFARRLTDVEGGELVLVPVGVILMVAAL